MDCTTLHRFRIDLYGCLTRAEAALFDLVDALLTDPLARSFVELSQSPVFRRQWPSVYAALRDGRLDRATLQRTCVAHMPSVPAGKRLLLGLDASSILRPDATTSADRTYVYQANVPLGATPAAPGWSFSGLVVLAQPISSWSYVLDQQRIASTSDAVTVGAAQLRAILPLLPVRAILLLDRFYSRVPWILATAGLPVDQFIRARCDQVLYRAAPPRTGKRGGPRKDGRRFKGSDPTTHGTPDATTTVTDANGRTTQVEVWHGLHLRQARQVAISVVRITRAAAAGTKRDPRESWFWWLGEPLPPLEEVAGLYGHRFGQEHGYRVDKQQLLWAAPHVRTPEQFELWTHVVAMVRNQLVVARTLGIGERRPWESTSRSVSPQQVRRAVARIIGHLGTPAPPPQRRGKAPGRAPGAKVRPAPRHPVIRKTKKTTKTKRKTAKNHRE